jgi:hypothetical protein
MSSEGASRREDGLPDHEEKAWAAIVADLSGQIDLGPDFPRERSLPPLAATGDHPDPLADPDELVGDLDEDEEGYEPPHPPPLPRPVDTLARFAWASVIGGPALVVVTRVLGWEGWLAGLGVAATVAGFGILIARLRDRDDDEDNGAIV